MERWLIVGYGWLKGKSISMVPWSSDDCVSLVVLSRSIGSKKLWISCPLRFLCDTPRKYSWKFAHLCCVPLLPITSKNLFTFSFVPNSWLPASKNSFTRPSISFSFCRLASLSGLLTNVNLALLTACVSLFPGAEDPGSFKAAQRCTQWAGRRLQATDRPDLVPQPSHQYRASPCSTRGKIEGNVWTPKGQTRALCGSRLGHTLSFILCYCWIWRVWMRWSIPLSTPIWSSLFWYRSRASIILGLIYSCVSLLRLWGSKSNFGYNNNWFSCEHERGAPARVLQYGSPAKGIHLSTCVLNAFFVECLCKIFEESPQLFLTNIKNAGDIEMWYNAFRSLPRGSNSRALSQDISDICTSVIDCWHFKEKAAKRQDA